MKTKTNILPILFILFLCSFTFAQTAGGNSKDRAKQNLENMKVKLNLSAAQTQKLNDILKDWENQVKELRKNNAASATNAKLLELKNKVNKRIEGILDAKQKITFNKMIEEQNKMINKNMK
jgi:septal ring factor EnvC (AmiA/AmiB activator)